MSYNGSGVYTLPGSALNNGEVVSATENNQFRNDVASALNVAWTRDGQAPATANIPMGSHKFTGLAAGSANGDSVRYEQVTSAVAITGGTISGVTISSLASDLAVEDGGTGAGTGDAALVNLGERTGATGSTKLPVGTIAQRDATPSSGYIRFNSEYTRFEGYNGTAWTQVGGGATGGGNDQIFMENGQTVTSNYTLTFGKNAVSAGPITVNSGVTVTIPTGSYWAIV